MPTDRRVALKRLLEICQRMALLAILPFHLDSCSFSSPAIASPAASSKAPGPSKPVSAQKQTVSIEPCSSYDPEPVFQSLKQALEKIGFAPSPGSTVLLKPNIMAQNTPDQAASTHPAVVEAVCRYFSEWNCRISIGDSSAFYQGGGTSLGLETTGMAAVAKKYRARLLPFESTRLRRLTTGTTLNPLYITEAVFDHDLVVNLPKLKIHRLARYSGAIKNNYGCVVGGTKQLYHKLYQDRPDYKEFWGKPLVEVCQAVSPHLTVMDAIVGLDHDGPAATGDPRKTGVLLASTSCAALDITVCRMIDFDPDWVPAVREAIHSGMADPDKIEVMGSIPSVPYTKLPDEPPKTGLSKKLDQYVFDSYLVTPGIDPDQCDQCGACIEDCAPQAISRNDQGYPVIHLDRCIYCYCCKSYCPQNAVSLHGSAMNYLIRGVRVILKI